MDFTWFGFIAFYFSSPREHPDKNLRPPGRTTARTAVQIKYVLRTSGMKNAMQFTRKRQFPASSDEQ